jgi:hypothetical protein
MPAVCKVCSHPQRNEIDAALASKTPRHEIMLRYSVKKDSLSRHFHKHIAALLRHESKPWDRLPGEKPRQWEAFECYLRLCTENLERDVTYVEVARLIGRSHNLTKQWAHLYRWKDRVSAWLEDIARVRLKRLRSQAEKSRERWRHNGRAMQSIGERRLANIDPEKLQPEEARRFVMDGTTLEHRGYEGVLERPDGNHSQVNVQINISQDHARRVIELHQSRLQLEGEEVPTLAQTDERSDL